MFRIWTKRLSMFSPHAIRLMLALGIAALFLGLFTELTSEVLEGPDQEVSEIDAAILNSAAVFRNPTLNAAMIDLTALGSATIVTMISVIGLILLLMTRDKLDALHLVLAAIGAGAWTGLLKNTFDRARPEVIPRLVEATGYSYPSGHALTAATMYLTLAIIACRYVKNFQKRVVIFTLSGLVVALTGISRIYLGVHYPSDVASGIFLGCAWALILASAFWHLTRKKIARGLQS